MIIKLQIGDYFPMLHVKPHAAYSELEIEPFLFHLKNMEHCNTTSFI